MAFSFTSNSTSCFFLGKLLSFAFIFGLPSKGSLFFIDLGGFHSLGKWLNLASLLGLWKWKNSGIHVLLCLLSILIISENGKFGLIICQSLHIGSLIISIFVVSSMINANSYCLSIGWRHFSILEFS